MQVEQTQDLLPWALYVVFGGMTGGIGRGIYESRRTTTYTEPTEPAPQKEFVIAKHIYESAVLGMVTFASLVFLALWTDKIPIQADTRHELTFMCFCVLGGTLYPLLTRITDRAYDRLFDQRLSNVERSSDRAEKNAARSVEYTQWISAGEEALRSGRPADLRAAKTGLEGIRQQFRRNRRLHVYLGRIYRALAMREEIPIAKKDRMLDRAILTLRLFIEDVDAFAGVPSVKVRSKAQIEEDRHDKADALFNIACYHALKAKILASVDPDKSRKLVEETYEILEESFRIDESTRHPAKNRQYADGDEDFDFVKGDEQRWGRLVAPCIASSEGSC